MYMVLPDSELNFLSLYFLAMCLYSTPWRTHSHMRVLRYLKACDMEGKQDKACSGWPSGRWPECVSRCFRKISRAGRVAQVVESLPGKCETLSSNPSTTKTKWNKGKYQMSSLGWEMKHLHPNTCLSWSHKAKEKKKEYSYHRCFAYPSIALRFAY
jgi:hypothetical protein